MWSIRSGGNLSRIDSSGLRDSRIRTYDENEKSFMATSISSRAEPRSGMPESFDKSQSPSGCVLQI